MISKCERLTKYENSEVKDTAYIKLTFKCAELPNSVKLGCNYYPIEPLRREPMLCSNCFRLGHTKKKCLKKSAICGKCLEAKHEFGEQECPLDKSQWKCRNCNVKGHSASWPRCPQRLKMKKALLIQSQNYMPLAAALEIVTGEPDITGAQDVLVFDRKSNRETQVIKKDRSQFPALRDSSSSARKSLDSIWGDDAPVGRVKSKFNGWSESIEGRVASTSSPSTSVSWATDKSSEKLTGNNPHESSQSSQSDLVSTLLNKFDTMHRENEKRFKIISDKLEDIKAQKEQQTQMIKEFVEVKRTKANPTEKIVLDIFDTLRQALEGKSEGIFNLAEKLSVSSHSISDELKKDISTLTQNLTS